MATGQPSFLQILLMVILGRPEGHRGHNFGRNGTGTPLLVAVPGSDKRSFLPRGVVVDGRSILGTHIRSLAIANVYLINGLWIITPMFSPLWAWLSIQNAFSDDETGVRKTS